MSRSEIEIIERGRFQDFRDPGMDKIRGQAGIYVGRVPDNRASIWNEIPAKREQLGEVERRWRGLVMDTYAIEKLTGWAPELSPPKDSPLFQWKVLAGSILPRPACVVRELSPADLSARVGSLSPRHCERSEAIQSASAKTLDCFAALAMTVTIELRADRTA